ncbi:hypothetical protein HaLaN_08331 [Haematococcus lacustris]|uniref:Uncharacterized protein n=1 Tax=Haematococcus lacustris TaxID=44745 RepID=A0A699Z038_HAELA|nr:hypothetical protein HaLaN_08331 [Haematococcus lacustris]
MWVGSGGPGAAGVRELWQRMSTLLDLGRAQPSFADNCGAALPNTAQLGRLREWRKLRETRELKGRRGRSPCPKEPCILSCETCGGAMWSGKRWACA